MQSDTHPIFSQFPNKAGDSGDSKSNAQFSNIYFDQLSARIKPMHKFRSHKSKKAQTTVEEYIIYAKMTNLWTG